MAMLLVQHVTKGRMLYIWPHYHLPLPLFIYTCAQVKPKRKLSDSVGSWDYFNIDFLFFTN